MILTRRQADAAINMGEFLDSNYASGIYNVAMKVEEWPSAQSFKTVTFSRGIISGQPIGMMGVTVKRSGQPDEFYMNYHELSTAYYLVT